VRYIFRTQNPVVREHRVGSSPTSGTRKSPAKLDKFLIERRGRSNTTSLFYTNYYTNALGKGIDSHRGRHPQTSRNTRSDDPA
jgi:hypothetical protein